MSRRYSVGVVTAYGAAKAGGYTGTYSQFCEDLADLGDNIAEVREARIEVDANKTAAQQAQEGAETAQGAAEDAAESVSQSAAQIEQNREDIDDLKSAFDDTDDVLNNEINLFNINATGIVTGKYMKSDGRLQTSSTGSVSDYIDVSYGETLVVYPSITNPWYCAFYSNDKTLIATYDSTIGTYTVPVNAKYFRFTYVTADGQNVRVIQKLSPTTVAQDKARLVSLDNKTDIIPYKIRFNALGGYKSEKTTDTLYPDDSLENRVRCNPVPVPETIEITALKSCRVYISFTDSSGGNYLAANNIDTGTVPAGTRLAYNIKSSLPSNVQNGYMYVSCIVSGIAVDTADTYVSVVCYQFGEFPYDKAGKNVSVYKFGGAGNDWCFVRTPSGYNPNRITPYPFVICNHGNGWIMDGTEEKANWTKRTMYVPLNDPDYIANPTQYNGTSDESLWYSNPTIEALLTAGYIVCGCENYRDNLYGNNNCRNACVDFFHHMVSHYNVEKRCYMIGASNGGLTTLNATYLLQGAVKAIVLQYPVTCLLNQYNSNSNQRGDIRTAYGIASSSPTEAELVAAFATHDPENTDVVSGVKIGTIPPTKIWYSEDDDVVDYQENTMVYAALLENSGKVIETVQASGEHGDYTHFDPVAIVEWFNAN